MVLFKKRGVSAVVATVMLITITVVAAGIIIAFVVPFVKDELKESKACLDFREGVEFGESKFNCYMQEAGGNNYRTGFSVKINKAGVKGFKISLIDDADNSVVNDITEGKLIGEIGMVTNPRTARGGALELPNAGGQKTYFIQESIPYVRGEIAPILESGESCSVADEIKFEICAGGVDLW